MRHRRKQVNLEPHLKHWVKGDSQFRSPDLEFYGGQFTQERMLRPTRLDAIPLSTESTVIEDIRDCRTWYAYEWKFQNRDRRLDRSRSQGQVYYGLAVDRMFWEMPGEPDVDDDDLAPQKALKKRDDVLMESGGHAFRIEPVHPMSVMFAPIHNPKIFIEEGMIFLYEMRKLKSSYGESAGMYADMAEDGALVFRGDKEPLQQWNDRQAFSNKRVHYLVCAYEDEETEQWTVCEYIYPNSTGDSPNFEMGQKLSEEVVPFGKCPYFVIPSGEYDMLATDPHLAFRPRMYPLYVDINDLNQVETKLWAYAIRNTNSVAVTLQGNAEATWTWLEQQYGMAEGEGSERGMVLPIADNGPDEWPVVPQLIKIPFETDQALMEQRRAIYDRIKEHQPNRFQTGNVSRTEVAEGKATAFANTQEASGLPSESDLGMQDSYGTRAELEAMRAAICYWPDTKLFPFLTTGDEPLMTGVDNPPARVGGSGAVNAKKMGQKHEVIVWTKNQTQAEEQIEALMSFQDEAQQIATRAQTIARRGYDDVQKQLELLEADQQEKDDAPHVRQLLQQTRLAIFMGLTGANQAALMGLPPPTPSGLPGPNPFPGPVEQTPPRSGTGPPNWKPQFMAEEQTTPGGAALQPGHGIAPSPNGFGQGSSPMGNGMAGR